MDNLSYDNTKIQESTEKMLKRSKRKTDLNRSKKLMLSGLAFACILVTSCSPFISSKDQIISYAEKKYGECEFIREETNGPGERKYRTVYLRDKATGIEYEVTSHMSSLNIDGSQGISSEVKDSDHTYKYVRYVIDRSRDELEKIMKKNNLVIDGVFDDEYPLLNQYWQFLSLDPVDGPAAEKLARQICKVIEKNDCKGLLTLTVCIFVENPKSSWKYDPSEFASGERVFLDDKCIMIGYCQTANGSWEDTFTSDAIDYVQKNYDQDLDFFHYEVYSLSSIMTDAQIKEYYPDKSPDDKVRMYQFTEKQFSYVYALAPYEKNKAPEDFKLFKDSDDRSSGLGICLEPVN